MQRFGELSEDELNELTKVPMYVGLLIASADDNLDEKELTWIDKVTVFRTKNAHHTLRPFYKKAHEQVEKHMDVIVSELPQDHAERMRFLSQKIEEAKPLLAKLNIRMKERLIDSFQSMALSVAEISGGIANFFSLNPQEEKWLSWLEEDMFDEEED